jgi:hypothetical protein
MHPEPLKRQRAEHVCSIGAYVAAAYGGRGVGRSRGDAFATMSIGASFRFDDGARTVTTESARGDQPVPHACAWLPPP